MGNIQSQRERERKKIYNSNTISIILNDTTEVK